MGTSVTDVIRGRDSVEVASRRLPPSSCLLPAVRLEPADELVELGR